MGKKLFDYVIGNPPYQEEVENKGDRNNPVYNYFMSESYEVADVVELITPARFLFNAGQTPKAWNNKMLNDEHLSVLYYEPDANKLFPNTEIKGGVAVTLRNANKTVVPIMVFTPYEQLNSILKKVVSVTEQDGFLNSIVSSRGQYRFSSQFYVDYPEASSLVGTGTGNMIVSNIFDKMPEVFAKEKVNQDDVKILGRTNNSRIYRYIPEKYVQNNPYIHTYNVCYPEATGKGSFGEVTGTPELSTPSSGATDTFISMGTFQTEIEAKSLILYLKTKFLRTMLGVKKVTQHNPQSVWQYIPLQDFTIESDVNWSKSIHEIDLQLYRKYGLDEKEIEFIETHVKEMA